MRTRWPLLVLFVVPFLIAADKLPEFKEYTSKDHGFSIKMPGNVKVKNEKVGDLVLTNYSVDVSESTTFMVAVSDYAKDTVKAGKEDELLDASRDGIVNSLKGMVLKEEKGLKLDDKYVGRELQVECPGIGTYCTRIFLVGDRMYQVIALAPDKLIYKEKEKKELTPEVAEFIKSFKLAK